MVCRLVCLMSGNINAVTVLTVKGSKRLLTKIHRPTGDGIKTEDYSNVLQFTAELKPFDTIHDLAGILDELRTRQQSCIIRAVPKADADLSNVNRRMIEHDGKEPPSMEPHPDGQTWLKVDLDDLPMPDSTGLIRDDSGSITGISDPAAVVGAIIAEHLPAYFHGVTVYYSFSASAGVKPWAQVRLGLYYVMTQRVHDSALRRWAKTVPTIDPAVYTSVQPNYTAEPSFRRMEDPCAGWRSGLIHGDRDKLELPQTALAEPINQQTQGGTEPHAPLTDAEANHARRYALAALNAEAQELSKQKEPGRHLALRDAGYAIGGYVFAGALTAAEVEDELYKAAETCGLTNDEGEDTVRANLQRYIRDGAAKPRAIPPPRKEPTITFTKSTPAVQAAIAERDSEPEGTPDAVPEPSVSEALDQVPDAEDQSAAVTAVFHALIREQATTVESEAALQRLKEHTGLGLVVLRKGLKEQQNALKPRRKTAAGMYAEHNGVLCRIEEHNAGKDETVIVPIALCNFTAWIEAEIERNDGEESTIVYSISGKTANGYPLPPIEVPAKQFPSMHWVAEWGSRAVLFAGMGTKDHARAAIQQLSEPAYHSEHTHTGWATSKGHSFYIHAGGRIAASDDAPEVGVSLTGELSKYELTPPADQTDAAAALRDSLELLDLAPANVMSALILTVYRAAIDRTTFSVHLAGRTGVGKTQAAAICQQHFGASMDASALPASWTSTANYLEAQAFHLKDALMVVDEFNDAARLNPTAERVMRAQGNTSGRGRMNADGTLKSIKTPRGTMLSTGEDLPNGHSLRARMLTLQLEPDGMNWSSLSIAQEKAEQGRYSTALAGFIQHLAADLEGHRAALKASQKSHRNALRPNSPHGRTADMGGELLATWELLERYALSINAYSPAELSKLDERVRGGILEVLAEQGAYLADADPVDRFFSLISSLLTSGSAHIADTNGDAPDDPGAYGWRETGTGNYIGWQPQGKRIGWLDAGTGEIWLHPDTVYAAVKQLAEAQGSTLPTSKQTLWKRLRERDLIIPGGTSADQRNTQKKTIGNARQNVIVLSPIGVSKTGTTGTDDAEGRAARNNSRPDSEKNRDTNRDTHRKTGTLQAENASIYEEDEAVIDIEGLQKQVPV